MTPAFSASRARFLFAALLTAATVSLTACTGTEERAPNLRLAVLTAGGEALGYVDTAPPESDASTPAAPTLTPVGPVDGGRDLHTADGGRSLLLTRRTGAERRRAELTPGTPFAGLPFPTCLTRSAVDAARTRLLVLSECSGDVQRLALYRMDGTVVWTATLGTAVPPLSTPDAPPVNIAVVGDVAVVSRPALGGGSEVVRAAPRNVGDPVAVASLPERTVAVRDLAALSGGTVYAATDSGVYPLLDTGLPDLTRRVAAFGERRLDRLWGEPLGARTLLFGWHDPALSGGDAYLRVWDGAASGTPPSTAQNVAYVTDLRDVTLAPDGNLYVLSRTALTRFDAVLGVQSGNWQARTLLVSLNDARALAWLVP